MARSICILAFLATATAVETARAAALSRNHTVFSGSSVDVTATLEQASRWSSVSGLGDGIQVAVMPGFAEALGASNAAEVASVEGAVSAAFSAWANSALQFQVTFDGAAVEGASLGFEFDLFAVPSSHAAFVGDTAFGTTFITESVFANRPLTNGQAFDGFAIQGSDVFICFDRVQELADQFGLSPEMRIQSLQRLLMHEIGHGIGMGHSNLFPTRNFDSDNDPMNLMLIDGANPFAGMIVSPALDADAIMSNQPAIAALFMTSLGNDDRGGRDLLYPVVPEPSTFLLGSLAAAGMAVLAIRRRNRRAAS